MTLARWSGSYESLVGRHFTPLSYLHGARFYYGVGGRDVKRQISETDEYIGDARGWRHCERPPSGRHSPPPGLLELYSRPEARRALRHPLISKVHYTTTANFAAFIIVPLYLAAPTD